MKVALECPHCESTNTRFAYKMKSQLRHYCNDCRRHWTLNGIMRDFLVSEGKREIRQPEISESDQGLIALECPRGKGTDTEFIHYQHQNESKPVHFWNNRQRRWTVGGKGKRRQPETSMADQAPMSEETLKCPQRVANYQYHKKLQPRHYGNDCRQHWTVNGNLRHTPIGEGKRERWQSEISAYDQALVARLGLECPRCEATDTKFMRYQFQNMSKPVHFCFNCRRHWTIGGTLSNRPGGGKRKIRQVALKCPRCESTNTNFFCHSKQNEPKPVHFCRNCRRYWSAGGSLRTKQQLKYSGLQASVKGQEEAWQFQGSCEMTSVGGFPFDDEVMPNEEVYLSNGSNSVESPESSNVVENSSFVEKWNSSNDFCSNAKGVEKAQHFSVDVTTTTSRQPSPAPSLESGLPFIKSSFMWPQVESMEVFRSMPQQPHFSPLKELDENLREGEAVGLMLSFTKLVEVTRKAQLDDSKTMFDMKFKALQNLEEHGFFVQPIRSQLVKLLRTKQTCGQLNGRLTTVTPEVNEGLESVPLFDMDTQIPKEMKAFKVAENKRRQFRSKKAFRQQDQISIN